MTVHTPGDPDKAVRIATAAALAESARKLAQEAASFIDDQVCVICTSLNYLLPIHNYKFNMCVYMYNIVNA